MNLKNLMLIALVTTVVYNGGFAAKKKSKEASKTSIKFNISKDTLNKFSACGFTTEKCSLDDLCKNIRSGLDGVNFQETFTKKCKEKMGIFLEPMCEAQFKPVVKAMKDSFQNICLAYTAAVKKQLTTKKTTAKKTTTETD